MGRYGDLEVAREEGSACLAVEEAEAMEDVLVRSALPTRRWRRWARSSPRKRGSMDAVDGMSEWNQSTPGTLESVRVAGTMLANG